MEVPLIEYASPVPPGLELGADAPGAGGAADPAPPPPAPQDPLLLGDPGLPQPTGGELLPAVPPGAPVADVAVSGAKSLPHPPVDPPAG